MAEPLYRRALEASSRQLGDENARTLKNLNHLAGILESRGDLTNAESLYRRALEGFEAVLGHQHQLTRTVRSHLESCHAQM